MFLSHPQEVDQQQVFLAGLRREPSAAAYHLRVQRSRLCGPQDDDAVHGRTVISFCQEHRIAEHIVLAVLKILQDLRPVFAVAVHFRSHKSAFVKNLHELLGCGDQGKEHDSLPVHAVFDHLVCDLIQVRVQSCSDLSDLEIAGADANHTDVDLERYRQRFDRHQVSAADCFRHRVFECQRLEVAPEVLHICPIGRCCDA